MSDKTEAVQKNSKVGDRYDIVDDEITVADVTVVPDDRPIDQISQTVSGDVEQISKNVTIGRVEIEREDGRNVIYAIINAISVRINMPRGTVKALMACFVILLIAALLYACNSLGSGSSDDSGSAERRYADNEISDRIAAGRNVAISENYSYTLPAGSIKEKPGLGAAYANAQAYSFTNDADEICVVRSYITHNDTGDLKSSVQSRMSKVVDITNVSYEYVECGLGTVLLCRFDSVDADDKAIHVMQYSWEDGDLAICSLDVSSASDDLEPTAQALLDTVHESDNDISNKDLLISTDSVPISDHYSYSVPDGVLGIWEPDELYAENEIFCDFEYDGDLYTIRSYVLEYSDTDLAELVKSYLAEFGDISYIDEQYSETDFGKMLTLKFETTDEYGDPVVVTGFYWYEMDPKICCLEVSSDEWRDGKAEQMILDSVYRKTDSSASGGSGDASQYGLSPEDMQKAYDDARMEEYQNQIVEDYYKDQINDYANEPHGFPY